MGPTSKKFLLAAIVPILAMAAGCASTGDGGTVASADFNDDPDRIICEKVQPTGSRLTERVCKTAREWELDAERTEEFRRNMQHKGLQPAPGGASSSP